MGYNYMFLSTVIVHIKQSFFQTVLSDHTTPLPYPNVSNIDYGLLYKIVIESTLVPVWNTIIIIK